MVLLVSIFLLVYGVVRYRRASQKSELAAFVGLILSISLTQIGVIMGDAVIQLERQLFWVNFVNGITMLLAVYTLLWFALAYAGHDQWINRWTVGTAVCHVAASGIAVAVAPEFMYEVTGQSVSGPVTFTGITFEEWVFLDRNPKLPFTFFQLYSYAVVLVSGLILTRYIVTDHTRLYAGQVATLAIGILTPVLLNSLVLIGAVSLTINYTTLSLGVTSIAFAIAIFRYRLFRLAPVGRQQLIDTMDDPVVMVDTADRIVDCNRAARYLVNSPQAWRGISIAEFFSPFPVELTQTDDFSNREIHYTKDGETQYFDSKTTPISTRKAGVVGHIIVLREVTALHEQRAQIEKQNEELEQFAHMVSHDLRNPLTIADGRLELAKDECDSSHLDDVSDAIDRSQSLVEDLLTVARSGGTVENREQVSLSELAQVCWHVIPSEDASLEIETDRTIVADSTRLRQLLENLFRNAVEHGEADTVTVGETTGGFYIADDGTGFSNEDYDEVFEAGYSTTEEGTGFGLEIVNKVTNAHGWEVQPTDSADGGAKFEITGVDTLE